MANLVTKINSLLCMPQAGEILNAVRKSVRNGIYYRDHTL